MYLYVSKPWLFKTKTSAKRHWPWHWILHLTTSLMQRHSLYMHIINHETTLAGGWGSGQFHKALLISAFPLSGWWFQPSWKILVNGKDYPIYYGKKNVPNHQPVVMLIILMISVGVRRFPFNLSPGSCEGGRCLVTPDPSYNDVILFDTGKGSRSSANRHPVSKKLTHIHLDDGSCNLCMDDKQCHTHTKKNTHTQYNVLPSQRTLSKNVKDAVCKQRPQGSNLGELHNYESVNTANTPKLTRSRYRHKEHPKGKRKP